MPPLDPRMLQMFASMGGPGGPGGAPMGGPPPGPMGPGMGGRPPLGIEQLGQEGMDALGALSNKEPSGELRVERVREALNVIHQLINACIPEVGIENMDLSKQLHGVGRQIAQIRINLSQENEAGMPPESMLGGIQGTGLPGRM